VTDNLKKWLVWAVMSGAFLVSMLQRNVAGVLQSTLMSDFQMSAAGYGWLASSYMYVFVIMQFLIGPLMDTKGVRKTSICGMFLACLGSIIFALAGNTPLLYTGRIFTAVGFAGAYTACVKVNAVNFKPEQFASVIGLTSFIGQIGGILSQSPFAFMMARWGWRCIFIGIGTVSFMLALCMFKVLEPGTTEKINYSQKRNVFHSQILLNIVNILRVNGMKYIVITAACGQGVTTMITAAWGVPFLRDIYGITLAAASSVMFYFLLGQMSGCLLVGMLSDKLRSRKNIFVALNMLSLIFYILIFVYQKIFSYAMMKVVFFIFGICSSSYIIRITMGKELCGTEYSASSFSMGNVGTFSGAALLTSVTGMILYSAQNVCKISAAYRLAFLPSAAAIALCFITSLFLPETFKK